jgi:hypothetical protein
VGSAYLNADPCFFGRLSSGGETYPTATFLATTLGLRRLLNFINRSNFCSRFLTFFSLFLAFKNVFENQFIIRKMKNGDFKAKEFCCKTPVYAGKKPSPTANFHAADRPNDNGRRDYEELDERSKGPGR